jgi:hypothetical protein
MTIRPSVWHPEQALQLLPYQLSNTNNGIVEMFRCLRSVPLSSVVTLGAAIAALEGSLVLAIINFFCWCLHLVTSVAFLLLISVHPSIGLTH